MIKQGVISEWQQVSFGPNGEIQRLAIQGRAGECAHPIRRSLTLPLAGIPSYTDTIVIPLPFPGLKQLESSLTLQLDAQAVAEAGFCPVFEPPRIEFQEEGNLFSGIHRFEMGAGLRDIEASTYLELNGLAEWGLRQRFPDPPITLIPVPAFFVGQVGPVSVWVGFDVLGSIPVEAGAELSVSGARLGVAYRGGGFIQRIRYQDGSGWENTPEFEAGQFSRILEGEIDLSGFLKVGVNPEIEAEIWGSVGPAPRLKLFTLPKIGLNFYAKAELELLPQDVAIQVSQPQAGASLDGRQAITLNARVSGDPQLRLLAGIDFTLRDGRVEEVCPLPQGRNLSRNNSDDEKCLPEIYIDSSRHPEAAQHAREAIARGKPTILTIDRDPPTRERVRARRNQSTSAIPPCPPNAKSHLTIFQITILLQYSTFH